tara:strand:- start:1388 stop:1603 length:216 start_codon:yes stop_codon:yes gene_type:complete
MKIEELLLYTIVPATGDDTSLDRSSLTCGKLDTLEDIEFKFHSFTAPSVPVEFRSRYDLESKHVGQTQHDL